MKLLVILLFCLLANQAKGWLEADRKCGENLTELMWLVCDNKNFNSLMNKRSGMSQTLVAEQPAFEVDVPYPYASSSLANIFRKDAENFLAKRRRMRMGGIAEECCRKPCMLSELTAYCILN